MPKRNFLSELINTPPERAKMMGECRVLAHVSLSPQRVWDDEPDLGAWPVRGAAVATGGEQERGRTEALYAHQVPLAPRQVQADEEDGRGGVGREELSEGGKEGRPNR
jgi:hypothetical protein